VGGTLKWYSCYEKQYDSSSKIKNRIPYDPVPTLLSIRGLKVESLRDIGTNTLMEHYSI
jgi:hypothetical protein